MDKIEDLWDSGELTYQGKNLISMYEADIKATKATGEGEEIRMIPGIVDIKTPYTGKGKFEFINSLGSEYDNTNANVKSVTFDISRYGKYSVTIMFEEEVTERTAIENVKTYLSVVLTEDYYNKIVDDLFLNSPWETISDCLMCRGSCLTDCKFLESAEVQDGNMRIMWGS